MSDTPKFEVIDRRKMKAEEEQVSQKAGAQAPPAPTEPPRACLASASYSSMRFESIRAWSIQPGRLPLCSQHLIGRVANPVADGTVTF